MPNLSSPWTLLSTSRAPCLHRLAALRNRSRSHDQGNPGLVWDMRMWDSRPRLSRKARLDIYNIAARPPSACDCALLRIASIAAGATSRPALFPQLFPIPEPVCHLLRQRESELMSEHTHLPAMVGLVRKHVAQHFHPNRPRPSPAVSAKHLDAAPTIAERFREHLRAASGALGQPRTSLPRRAASTVELRWNV